MAVYVAFLRAINLGAKRKFPKAEIVAATEAAGFTGVETHINTGNVRLETKLRSRAKIEAALEDAYLERTGFEVPTIVFSAAELHNLMTYADQIGPEHDGARYVSLLKDAPDAALAKRLTDGWPGQVYVDGRGVHLLLPEDYHRSPLTNASVEKALGVATNRNLRVVRTVTDKWCG